MKIVMLEQNAVNPGDVDDTGYRELGEVIAYPRTPAEEIAARIGDAEVVLINKCPITREVLAACPKLRYIGVQATGYNVVDIAAARERGVVVTNIPAYSTPSVTQHVFALLLALCSHVDHHARAVREGRWITAPDFTFWDQPLTELSGKTLGIIGYGQIGRSVARVAEAFGMRVLAYGPHKREACMTDLETVLRESDMVTLHCPMNEQSRELMNRETLAMMKPGALLINTARGGVVNEQAVGEALASGRLGGYAADVVAVEPMLPDNPLRLAPNCILTPHLAWAPVEARQRLISISLNNLKAWLAGQPVNVVS